MLACRSALLRFLSLLPPAALFLAAVAPAQQTTPTPPAAPAAPVATPNPTNPKPPDVAAMTPRQLSILAAHNISLAARAAEHYTYSESVHEQNFIDGKLVVDHTTVTENLFINDLPYMRKVSVDGRPLEGKELKQEQKLYDEAVKERRALDPATRARLAKVPPPRGTVANIDKLPTSFDLKLDGHTTIDGTDCIVLDAMPLPYNTDPDLAQHIRIAMEADTGDVLDVTVELLAPDRGFSKGSLLHTRYKFVGANALPEHQTWDTTVTLMELMNKAIRIHREITYSNYKRFRATVTIESVREASSTTH